MLAQQPIKTNSGTVRITDTSVFPASKTISAALVEVQPGAMRGCIGIPTPTNGSIMSSYYADVSLNQWLALTPPELVKAHLKLDPQALVGLHKEKFPVVPG
jgi:oxalate decarboxylase